MLKKQGEEFLVVSLKISRRYSR